MKRKASKPRSVEQIIRILRQADGDQTVAEICREHNIAEGTFIMDRTTDGRPVKMLTMVDEYTRQCLIIHPARSITSDQVLDILEYLAKAWVRITAKAKAGR